MSMMAFVSVSEVELAGGRRRRFEPGSHPRWRIVEVSNRPPNLSTKQSELTIRIQKTVSKGEKKTHPLRKKTYETVNLALICPRIDKKCLTF